MIWKGFCFGMLLQLAIGPVCTFIFQTSLTQGFLPALGGVLGVALTDGTEILLAIWGVGAILQRSEGAKAFARWFGAGILLLFGVSSILGAFGITLLPGLGLSIQSGGSVFLRAVVLTLSNPLTIVFWAGVFTTRIAEGDLSDGDQKTFGLGCVLATLFFLSLVAGVGHVTHQMLPEEVILILNVAVGCVLVGFGLRQLAGKR